jgi:hypothetical protein
LGGCWSAAAESGRTQTTSPRTTKRRNKYPNPKRESLLNSWNCRHANDLSQPDALARDGESQRIPRLRFGLGSRQQAGERETVCNPLRERGILGTSFALRVMNNPSSFSKFMRYLTASQRFVISRTSLQCPTLCCTQQLVATILPV